MFKEMQNPDLFHGRQPWNKFEGWYFKTSHKSGLSFAIIPGISMFKNDSHAFIQLLWGSENKFSYFRLPHKSFKSGQNPFSINIEGNEFSFDGISLKLSNETDQLETVLSFSNGFKWNPDSRSHKSMGFYNYIPFMECYTQVCRVDMDVSGYVNFNGNQYLIDNGKGYIEKNWGNAFPYSWIWIQSNSFNKSNTALTASIAHIPFPLGSFRGFLIGFLHDGKFYSFTTMNKSRITIDKKGKDVYIAAVNNKYSLAMETSSLDENFILCKGPVSGKMNDTVRETLTANVKVTLTDKRNNRIIFDGTGINTGIEYGGEHTKILDS